MFHNYVFNNYSYNVIGDEGAKELGKSFILLPKILINFTLGLEFSKKIFIYYKISNTVYNDFC